MLNAIAPHVPFLLGGSADLAPSNKSNLTFEGAGSLTPLNPGGRNVHFGVREHAMGSIVNGWASSACGPTAQPSWSSPTTCAPRSGSPR